ncbi:helix-turn-helix domain-containing protein [Sphingomicrobium astaxanthinifaciens]|uniref:helix-turn-helix domain-containing protein n=1 Tax=Sphingomicrobium astaxanthinifaciens TaxID=1227949 RepID=UPI001FCA5204|nr:helix-turn-helix transcriptional regulator [Sphingomicrobium astaxanthinifaciens]MCJ7420452.1 helix-turn-helix domain-containing protein [Sphingomicrobium astaxanthinifaciens]
MAELEGNASIAAGALALDPVFEEAPAVADADEANVAFGRFVRLMRRSRRMSREQLAEQADIDIKELIEIEDDVRHKPDIRSVYQLSRVFKLPSAKLMHVAGLAKARNDNLERHMERFAARSDPMADLTDEERAALEDFVAQLSLDK